MYGSAEMNNPQRVRAITVAVLVVLFIVIVVVLANLSSPRPEAYSVGYQIGPHYPGNGSTSTWRGIPYAMAGSDGTRSSCDSKSHFTGGGFYPYAPADDEDVVGADDVTNLIYEPPFTQNLRGDFPNWWTPSGGTYSLPPAADRPDFWAGDATIHTYLARDVLPQLCESQAVADDKRRITNAEWVEKWRRYGGPRGWNMSPFY